MGTISKDSKSHVYVRKFLSWGLGHISWCHQSVMAKMSFLNLALC